MCRIFFDVYCFDIEVCEVWIYLDNFIWLIEVEQIRVLFIVDQIQFGKMKYCVFLEVYEEYLYEVNGMEILDFVDGQLWFLDWNFELVLFFGFVFYGNGLGIGDVIGFYYCIVWMYGNFVLEVCFVFCQVVIDIDVFVVWCYGSSCGILFVIYCIGYGGGRGVIFYFVVFLVVLEYVVICSIVIVVVVEFVVV